MIHPFCIIQARSGSTRLPQKMGLKLQGRTLLARAWHQAVGIFGTSNVVIAAPFGDGLIQTYAPDHVRVFYAPGDEADVLGRFWHCVGYHNAFNRPIVRWTPDDWRKDDWLVRQAVKGRIDASVAQSVETFPGTLLDHWHWHTPMSKREHMGYLLSGRRPLPPDDGLPWSIDTQQDYDQVVAVVGR